MHLEIARDDDTDHFAKLLAAMHERYQANDITPGDIRAATDRELFDWTGKRPTTTASTNPASTNPAVPTQGIPPMTPIAENSIDDAPPSTGHPSSPGSLLATCPFKIHDVERIRAMDAAMDAALDGMDDLIRTAARRPGRKPLCDAPSQALVSAALEAAHTLDEFATLLAGQGWTLELRSYNPTLLRPGRRGKVRLATMGLRTAFWLKFVVDWGGSFVAIGWDRYLPTRLWRGLTGEHPTDRQGELLGSLRYKLGDHGLAIAMCEAVRSNMDGTPQEQFRMLEAPRDGLFDWGQPEAVTGQAGYE
jgi:hypothetical protein